MKPSLRCNNPRCEAQNPCQRARHVIYSAFWPGLLALERHKKSPAQRPITHRLQLNYTIIATIPSRKIHRLQMGYTIEVNSKRDLNKCGPKKSDRPFYRHKTPLRATLGDSVDYVRHRKRAASGCSQLNIMCRIIRLLEVIV